VNEAGTALAPLQLAVNPVTIEALGAMVAFHDRLVTVTLAPLWVYWPDQSCISVWPFANDHTSDQPLIRPRGGAW
jgi:hypothetical protein